MEFFPVPKTKECMVSDLQWETLDQMNAGIFGHERIEQLINDGARWFVRYKNGADLNYGIGRELDLDQYKGLNLISIAGLVATHPFFKGVTVLLLLKNQNFDDDASFAIGLINGNVRLDKVFSTNNLQSIIDEFNMLVRGKSYVIWGDVVGAAISKPYTLASLLDAKGGKRLKIAPLKNEKKALIFTIALGISIALLLVYWGWDWYREKQNQILETIRQTQRSPDYIYDQSLKAYFLQPVIIASQSAPMIIEQLNQFPITNNGWRLISITCNLQECEASWRSIGGTYEEFKSGANKNWGKIAFANTDSEVLGDLKTIRHTFTLEVKTNSIPPVGQWPKKDAFEFTIGNKWQRYAKSGWAAQLKPPEQQAVPESINLLAVRNHPRAIFAMPWISANQSWNLAQKVIVDLPNNVTLNQIKLQIVEKDKEVLFSGNGLAYVQK